MNYCIFVNKSRVVIHVVILFSFLLLFLEINRGSRIATSIIPTL